MSGTLFENFGSNRSAFYYTNGVLQVSSNPLLGSLIQVNGVNDVGQILVNIPEGANYIYDFGTQDAPEPAALCLAGLGMFLTWVAFWTQRSGGPAS